VVLREDVELGAPAPVRVRRQRAGALFRVEEREAVEGVAGRPAVSPAGGSVDALGELPFEEAVLVREGFDESPGVNARRVAFHRRWEGIDEIVLREGAVIAAEAGKRVGVAPPAERPLVVQRGGAVAPAVARRSGLEQGVPDRLSGIVAVDKAPGFVAGT